MRVSARLPSYWRRFGAVGVLLALLLRFAVPTGYMLAGDGSLAVVPCPSAGPVAPAISPGDADNAAMAMDHAMPMDAAMAALMPHEHHDPAGHQDTSCPYAALSAPVLPPQPPLLIAPEWPAFAAYAVPVARTSATRALAAPPPPSRGPPILS